MEIRDLIALLERADGPSRELDLEILRAVSGQDWRVYPHELEDGLVTVETYGPLAVGNPVAELERYTFSLDAALTLVPEGARWAIGKRWDGIVFCHVEPNDGGPKLSLVEALVEGLLTPAIALCIAALKART